MASPFCSTEKTRGLTLSLVLILATIYRGYAQWHSGIQLYFDEAYYFTWANEPAFGYYSKPPMIAWEIWASVKVCGDAEPCVRMGALLSFFVSSILQYFLARKLFGSETAFFSALAFASLPFVSLYSWMATTDSLLILYWTASTLFFLRSLETEKIRDFVLLGFFIGLGLLSKYTMLFFFLCAAVYMLLAKIRPGYKWIIPVGVALLILSPNLLWNYQHQGVSFSHTAEISKLGGELFHPIKLAEFVGGQFVVFGPVFMAMLLFLLCRGHVANAWVSQRFLLSFGAPVLICYAMLALLTRANLNWAVVSYVAATAVIIDFMLGKKLYRLIYAGIALNVAIGLMGYHERAISKTLGIELSYKQDIFSQMTGWRELGEKIEAIRTAHPDSRLLADNRRLLSELVYYIKPHPFDAVIWNPSGVTTDQFSLKSDLKSVPNGDFFFVAETVTLDMIRDKFQTVEMVDRVEVPIYPDHKLFYNVYFAKHFLGY
jgi:4-amino-4-deoxy-L-arabinose transferase-like glycosyltransferase